jgi:hypothetical protein
VTAAKNRGKSFERRVAEVFGGTRTGYMDGQPDVTTARLVIEAKRVDEASVRGTWIAQARRSSAKHKKPWLLVHARRGARSSTTTMETSFALELLRAAGYITTEGGVE